jgi:hypothetical protein
VAPIQLLKDAIRAVPAVRYALGVAGVASVIAIIAGFQIDYKVAVFGTIIIFGLMFILLIFSGFASSASSNVKPLALTLAWGFVVLTISASLFLLSSYFFQWPRSLEAYVAESGYIEVSFSADLPLEEVVKLAEPADASIVFNANCGQSVREATVARGDHRGKDIQEFLLKLKDRIKQSGIDYSVVKKGANRYEILCQ